MHARRIGKTGLQVSEIGFGAWAIGDSWGETDDAQSLEALHAAVDAGRTFFDTADVLRRRSLGAAPRAAASASEGAARGRDQVRPPRPARCFESFEAVSTIIPGAKTVEQARANSAAPELPELPEATMRRNSELYQERIAPLVHHRW